MFDCRAARLARGLPKPGAARGAHGRGVRRGALRGGLVRRRARPPVDGGPRGRAALLGELDRVLDRLRPRGRGHRRRAGPRPRGGARRGAGAGARPRRTPQPEPHHRRPGAAGRECLLGQRQGHRALHDRLRAKAGLRPPALPQRDAHGLGGVPAGRVHALRPRRRGGALRPRPRRAREGPPPHGADRHARGLGGRRGTRPGGVHGVSLRDGGVVRLAARGAAQRADVHRLPVGALPLRQDADAQGRRLGVGGTRPRARTPTSARSPTLRSRS